MADDDTILIITEELDLRIFTANLLTAAGYAIEEASGSRDGLRRARGRQPALIVLDAMMSTQGWLAVYQQLKQDRDLQSVPVVLMADLDRDTFFHYGWFQRTPSAPGFPVPDGYLEKPPEAGDLLEVVKRFVPPRPEDTE